MTGALHALDVPYMHIFIPTPGLVFNVLIWVNFYPLYEVTRVVKILKICKTITIGVFAV